MESYERWGKGMAVLYNKALQGNSREAVQALLDHDADPNLAGVDTRTALQSAFAHVAGPPYEADDLSPQARSHFKMEPPAFQLHAWRPGMGVVSHTAYIGDFAGPFPFFEGEQLID